MRLPLAPLPLHLPISGTVDAPSEMKPCRRFWHGFDQEYRLSPCYGFQSLALGATWVDLLADRKDGIVSMLGGNTH
jgi:hypothetical protein